MNKRQKLRFELAKIEEVKQTIKEKIPEKTDLQVGGKVPERKV